MNNPLTAIDFYKTDHRRQYPEGTTLIYSNFTPRKSRISGINEIIFFGLQYFINHFLFQSWDETFFNVSQRSVLKVYKERMDYALGHDSIDLKHIEALHDLGYLPLHIKALPEGSRVPIGVPVLTVVNTHPDFFWLTNYIESALSCYLWKPITSATIAYEYKKILTKYAEETGASLDFVNFQAHDFSFRGMSNLEDAALSGAGHLTSFYGTDTVQAIDLLCEYYKADVKKEIVGCSVPATEHSVMCMGTAEKELDTFKRLINELYPTGIVSIVSDSWDYWKVITEYVVALKEDILKRDGKVVIRPDSGDPVKIICGDPQAPVGSPEYKGSVECLWEVFGGVVNSKGFRELDSHIGLIYGDSITLERAEQILSQLKEKGFASSNIVFGIGSYTYQYNTRDTFGFAMKATYGEIKGDGREIFKCPKTDGGEKKSAKGLLRVEKENGKFVLHESQTKEQEQQGELKTVFLNNMYLNDRDNLSVIRTRIKGK